jgi:hypothetical protein
VNEIWEEHLKPELKQNNEWRAMGWLRINMISTIEFIRLPSLTGGPFDRKHSAKADSSTNNGRVGIGNNLHETGNVE